MIETLTKQDPRAGLFPRPVVFYDLETTGVDPASDRIVQIAAVKFIPETQEAVYLNQLINPLKPIPAGASEVHGILDRDVHLKPSFKEIFQDLLDFFGDADLGGFNILGYDIPCLMQHFTDIGISWTYKGRKIYDAYAVFTKMFPRNLTSALKFYCDKEMSDLGGAAHDAFTDTLASMEVFLGQMHRYSKTPDDLHSLVMADRLDLSGKLIRNMDGEIAISFGKYKGVSVQEINKKDAGYIYWILNQAPNMPVDTKQTLSLALKGLIK